MDLHQIIALTYHDILGSFYQTRLNGVSSCFLINANFEYHFLAYKNDSLAECICIDKKEEKEEKEEAYIPVNVVKRLLLCW